MNYKKIILIILLIFVIASVIFVAYNEFNNVPVYDVSVVCSTEQGTVYRIVTGNNNSEEAIGLILGVHSRESDIHEAINDTFYNICKLNQTRDLNKKYIIYYIQLNDNISGRADTREAGESLAESIVVPNIVKENVSLIIDVHMISPYYEYSNFVFGFENNSDAEYYAEVIANDLDIKNFKFEEGSSPSRVTIPIAKTGIPTLLIEFDINNRNVNQIAEDFIKSIDNLDLK